LIEDRLKEVENRVTMLEGSGARPEFEEVELNVGIIVPETVAPEVTETVSEIDDAVNMDLAEDFIDGMGVVAFAPEEECASFGTPAFKFHLLKLTCTCRPIIQHCIPREDMQSSC
jgi:hypothetical protein